MTSSQDNLFYLTALKATEEIEEPAIGLSQSTGKAAGISESNRVLIRQNNTIIELCVRLSNQVSQLEARIRSLEANKQAERGITPDLVSNLDLALIEKPSSKELAHNIAVIYDRICLLSKVSLKESRNLATENQVLKISLEKLQIKVVKLEKEVVNLTSFLLAQKPLTKQELQSLVASLTHQSKKFKYKDKN